MLAVGRGVVEGGELVQQSRDQPLGVVDLELIEQDAELLAAIPADDVGAAQVLAQRGGQGGEHAVAGLVAVGVVDLLEVVHVQQDEGGGARGGARAPIDGLLHLLHERRVRQQPGQAIAIQQALEEPGPFEARADRRREQGRVHRLGEVLVAAGLGRADARLHLGLGRQEDDGQGGVLLLLAHEAGQVVARDLRQVDVHQQEFGLEGRHALAEVAGRAADVDEVSRRLEHGPGEGGVELVVFHHEDARDLGLRALQHLEQLAMRGLDLGRLGIAGVGTGVDGLGQVEDVAGRAEHEDGGIAAIGHLAGELHDGVAGSIREADVDQQAVRHPLLDEGAGLRAGAGLSDRDALVDQHRGQQSAGFLVLVDEQHVEGAPGRFGRPGVDD